MFIAVGCNRVTLPATRNAAWIKLWIDVTDMVCRSRVQPFFSGRVDLTWESGGNRACNHRAISDLCLRKTRAGKSRDYRDVIVFEKLRFQMFCIQKKTKSWRFQVLPVWGAFSKSSVFVTDECPNGRNEAVFLNFSGVVWVRSETGKLIWFTQPFINVYY